MDFTEIEKLISLLGNLGLGALIGGVNSGDGILISTCQFADVSAKTIDAI